ncbi:MAG: hypothetical protein CL582_18680, partial [Alteromonadaceae bacterium]|nr:hypothetical protein [Alteromonadaceae bacterium]
MSNDNIKEPTEALRELMKGSKVETLPGFISGWKAVNRLFGPTGRLVRGKFGLIGGLTHNYKTGLLVDLFTDFCTLNKPDDVDGGSKPLNIYYSTETTPSQLFCEIYESMTNLSSKSVDITEIEGTVVRELARAGFNYEIVTVDPTRFSSADLINSLQGYIEAGYDVCSVFFDNVALTRKRGETLDSALRSLKDFMSKSNILFIGTHGLSQKSMTIKRNGQANFLGEIADEDPWDEGNQIPHICDIEIFVDTAESSGEHYLQIARGLGSVDDPDPFEMRNFYLPFSKNGRRLKLESGDQDISVTKLRSDPLQLKTNRFKPEEILYESGGFVIASGTWTEPDSNGVSDKLACRWHPQDGIGYPNGFGRPQWMNLGRLRRDDVEVHKLSKFAKRIKLNFNPDHSEIVVGQWARIGDEWYLVNYVYGSEGNMVSAMGRGKSGPFPIDTTEIDEVSDGRSTLGIWHDLKSKGDYLVWITPRGALATTKVDDTINQNGNIIQKNIYLE